MTQGRVGAAIELKDLTFGWNDEPLLAIEHLRVARGERLFLQGPSGSGKSTLLGLLGGVIAPTSGTISVLDTALDRLAGAERDRFRADHIGFIFQQFNLLPFLDVLDNVLLPCHFSAHRAQRAAAAVGSVNAAALYLLDALGLNSETFAHRSARDLSVGQQQRVAAARALIGAPEILIVDEPTSALDEDSRTAFLSLLIAQCHRNDSSLVFVSHDPSLAQFFERRIKLSDISKTNARAVH